MDDIVRHRRIMQDAAADSSAADSAGPFAPLICQSTLDDIVTDDGSRASTTIGGMSTAAGTQTAMLPGDASPASPFMGRPLPASSEDATGKGTHGGHPEPNDAGAADARTRTPGVPTPKAAILPTSVATQVSVEIGTVRGAGTALGPGFPPRLPAAPGRDGAMGASAPTGRPDPVHPSGGTCAAASSVVSWFVPSPMPGPSRGPAGTTCVPRPSAPDRYETTGTTTEDGEKDLANVAVDTSMAGANASATFAPRGLPATEGTHSPVARGAKTGHPTPAPAISVSPECADADDQPITGRLGPVGGGSTGTTCLCLGPSQPSRPVPKRHALILPLGGPTPLAPTTKSGRSESSSSSLPPSWPRLLQTSSGRVGHRVFSFSECALCLGCENRRLMAPYTRDRCGDVALPGFGGAVSPGSTQHPRVVLGGLWVAGGVFGP